MNSAGEPPPILVTPKEAARMLGLGRTVLFALMRSGELRSVKVGRSRRIPVGSLEAFVAHLEKNQIVE